MDSASAEFCRYHVPENEWPILLGFGELLPRPLRLATLAVGARHLEFDPAPFISALAKEPVQELFVDNLHDYGAWGRYARSFLDGYDQGSWIPANDENSALSNQLRELLHDLEVCRRTTATASEPSLEMVKNAHLRRATQLVRSGDTSDTELSRLSQLIACHRGAGIAILASDSARAHQHLLCAFSQLDHSTLDCLRSIFLPRLLLARL